MNLIIQCIQPVTVGAFLVIGALLLVQAQWQYGLINTALGVANLLIFYGDKIFKH